MAIDEQRRLQDVAFTTAVLFTEDGTNVRYDALAENLTNLSEAGAVVHPLR